jgi:hypothetical protein
VVLLIFLASLACGKTPNKDPFDNPTRAQRPFYLEMVQAAKAGGFTHCGPVNDFGVTECSVGSRAQRQYIEITEGNPGYAKGEYQSKCAAPASGELPWVIWYDDSDWIIEAPDEFVTPAEIKAVSKVIGPARSCAYGD